ncbi:glycosyltransferase family 4 protein [Cryomorpha ignava]|uniref:Glycosyltransferase family 4 protein n=1 Tax=Cryomorpha ignava TaxID=101383 RepID=A0A7K3WXG6_9FLAO|nr:glycosyltransferase family 4 protein [Cryomorpha ignava]NEN25791.1 glycosyltransferase family 4 protein [Cryomorpha ignava]
MKITIVCGHFIPSLGYLEVHLARAFAFLGHSTTVITSTIIPAYVGNLKNGFGDNPDGVEVTRLKPRFTLGQIVIAGGIKRKLNRIQPDLVVVIGLGKAFPKPVFATKYPVVSLFGDNTYSYANGSVKTKILFNLFKKATYRKAIRGSANLVAYTPESFEAAAVMMGGREAAILRKQTQFISLGFWPDAFYTSPISRNAKRAELGYSESDKVIITATRVVPEKKLEAVIPLLATIPPHVKWLVVGSAGDEYSRELDENFQSFIGKGRIKMLGYASKSDLNALYNAADLALYTVPAISIFEAIGAGLPVVVGADKSLERIANGGYCLTPYRGSSTDLDAWAAAENESEEVRMERSLQAKREFGWEKLAEELLRICDR